MWDEARVFVGDNDFGGGIKAPLFNGKTISESQICLSEKWIQNNKLSIYSNGKEYNI